MPVLVGVGVCAALDGPAANSSCIEPVGVDVSETERVAVWGGALIAEDGVEEEENVRTALRFVCISPAVLPVLGVVPSSLIMGHTRHALLQCSLLSNKTKKAFDSKDSNRDAWNTGTIVKQYNIQAYVCIKYFYGINYCPDWSY